ncbi:MAG TPA: class I SAM-dependent methyltransferase [Chloroflexia bacterium]|nr:class I SAM-dependent methyltransferase [Chloroflexia bacterium]
MPGLAFDWAADFYDQTRGFPQTVPEKIRDAIVNYTRSGSNSRFLEMGVGTGRVALPFIRGCFDYTGVDLSQPMMAKLIEKLQADPAYASYRYRLLKADMMHLPLPDASFDVVLMVLVLHLVADWQQALREASRVVKKPGGWIIMGYDARAESEGQAETSASHLVNLQWDAILAELGVIRDKLQPGIGRSDSSQTSESIAKFLEAAGAKVETITLLEYDSLPLTPREMVQRHKQKMYSSDRLLPSDIHARAIQQLEDWLETACPDPDLARVSRVQFKAQAATWS